MKTFRQRFLELYEKTHPEKPYAKDLTRYRAIGQDQRLPYHNSVHVYGVLRLVSTFRKLDPELPKGPVVRAMELAAVYHDFNHTGQPDAHQDVAGHDNLHRARSGLRDSIHVTLLPADLIEAAENLIELTRYPHAPLTTQDPLTRRTVETLRDADMLWGLLPENHRDCLVGVGLEFADPRPEDPLTLDWVGIVQRQTAFITAYTPYTSLGRSFKNAFLAEAVEDWTRFPAELHALSAKTAALVKQQQAERDGAAALAATLARRPSA
jgi:hypothetical protein